MQENRRCGVQYEELAERAQKLRTLSRASSLRYAAMEGTFSDSQNLRRAAFVIAYLTESELDVGSFYFVQSRALAKLEHGCQRVGSRQIHLRNAQRGRKVLNLHRALACHDHRALQHIPKFADVAGPGMAHQPGQHFRIDATHSNAYTAWQRLGSPAVPTAAQYKQLEAASELAPLAPAAPLQT